MCNIYKTSKPLLWMKEDKISQLIFFLYLLHVEMTFWMDRLKENILLKLICLFVFTFT